MKPGDKHTLRRLAKDARKIAEDARDLRAEVKGFEALGGGPIGQTANLEQLEGLAFLVAKAIGDLQSKNNPGGEA